MAQSTEKVESADGTPIVFHTRGDGPPLVIVHGALVTLHTYLDLAERLESEYRVVVVERRGYPPSGSRPGPAEFATQADDLAAVLAAVGEPAFVFGHSAGGLVALHAVQRDASMVRRLALYEPPVVYAGPPLRPTLETIRQQMAEGRPADAIVEFFSAIVEPKPPRSVLRPLGDALAFRATGLVADLECLTAMDPDLTAWSGIGIPTLLLTGEITDPYGTKSTELLGATLPDTRAITLAGQRHHPEDTAAVAAALREFFGQETAPRGSSPAAR
ncbi:alpha/beta fold hydrolase [Nocardia tengchongensis]|uniref:alpha/beta fold hydrolase n=2 Tax=Nocardia tengchongensis TaxID=2055889 RepID=UPI0036B13109